MSCKIEGAYESDLKDFDIEFAGMGARVLYNQLRNLTVEPYHSMSEEEVRDGSRIKAALVSDTEESSTVLIPSIHFGTLTCPQVHGKARCEIELNVLNAFLYSYTR